MKKIISSILIIACLIGCLSACVEVEDAEGQNGAQSSELEYLQSGDVTPDNSEVEASTEPDTDVDSSTESSPEDNNDEPAELSLEYVKSHINKFSFKKITYKVGGGTK